MAHQGGSSIGLFNLNDLPQPPAEYQLGGIPAGTMLNKWKLDEWAALAAYHAFGFQYEIPDKAKRQDYFNIINVIFYHKHGMSTDVTLHAVGNVGPGSLPTKLRQAFNIPGYFLTHDAVQNLLQPAVHLREPSAKKPKGKSRNALFIDSNASDVKNWSTAEDVIETREDMDVDTPSGGFPRLAPILMVDDPSQPYDQVHPYTQTEFLQTQTIDISTQTDNLHNSGLDHSSQIVQTQIVDFDRPSKNIYIRGIDAGTQTLFIQPKLTESGTQTEIPPRQAAKKSTSTNTIGSQFVHAGTQTETLEAQGIEKPSEDRLFGDSPLRASNADDGHVEDSLFGDSPPRAINPDDQDVTRNDFLRSIEDALASSLTDRLTETLSRSSKLRTPSSFRVLGPAVIATNDNQSRGQLITSDHACARISLAFKNNPWSYDFAAGGEGHDFYGYGPTWWNNSCAWDSIIVLTKLLHSSSNILSRLDKTILRPDQRLFLQHVLFDYTTMTEQRSIAYRNSFIAYYAAAHKERNPSSQPFVPGQMQYVLRLWEDITTNFRTFTIQCRTVIDECPCKNTSQRVRKASCIPGITPSIQQASTLSSTSTLPHHTQQIDLQILLQRYFKRIDRCNACGHGTRSERSVITGSLPSHLVVTLSAPIIPLSHTRKFELTYDQMTSESPTSSLETQTHKATYRWLGGIYVKDLGNIPHFTVFWNDGPDHFIHYDGLKINGAIVGGLRAPSTTHENRIPESWMRKTPPLLIYERVIEDQEVSEPEIADDPTCATITSTVAQIMQTIESNLRSRPTPSRTPMPVEVYDSIFNRTRLPSQARSDPSSFSAGPPSSSQQPQQQPLNHPPPPDSQITYNQVPNLNPPPPPSFQPYPLQSHPPPQPSIPASNPSSQTSLISQSFHQFAWPPHSQPALTSPSGTQNVKNVERKRKRGGDEEDGDEREAGKTIRRRS
ncbi:hypothetical protein UCRPC4_g05063 [Phaeomoniella chlamydospora]|uniref:Uncharacterized protein n=1 Tax=Phaeomoniella chlamydospora TaxID=158046 RepID=A0A0G2G2R9_PHACM|nr:hypothetical protein UCRPC4_g05063 [Phaeomoniella chlamydospora]